MAREPGVTKEDVRNAINHYGKDTNPGQVRIQSYLRAQGKTVSQGVVRRFMKDIADEEVAEAKIKAERLKVPPDISETTQALFDTAAQQLARIREEAFAEANQMVEEAEAKVLAAEAALEEQQQATEAAQAVIAGWVKRVAQMEQQVKEAQVERDRLAEKLADSQSQLAERERFLEEAQAHRVSIQQQLTRQAQEYAKRESALRQDQEQTNTRFTWEIQNLRTDKTNQARELAAAHKAEEDLREGAEQEKTALQFEIDSVRETLNQARSEKATLQSDVARLNNRVAELERQLALTETLNQTAQALVNLQGLIKSGQTQVGALQETLTALPVKLIEQLRQVPDNDQEG